MSFKCPNCGATLTIKSYVTPPAQAETENPPTPPTFPDQYAEMLTVTDRDTFWHVKAKQYIHNKDDFHNIADIVKQYGGHYVSDGKESHFRIPK